MYGLQPWLEARPAAVGSLDDDYYCITTLPGLNAVPSCVRKKIARMWITLHERTVFDELAGNGQGDDRPGRSLPEDLAFELYLQDFSWQANQAGLGHVGRPVRPVI